MMNKVIIHDSSMPAKSPSRRKKKGRPNGVSTFSILAVARLKRGLSQQEVAEATYCSQSYVSKVEKGRVPDVLYLYRVAALFKVPSLGEFFEQYVTETFDRISAFVKTASPKHQPILEEEEDTGQHESIPSASSTTDSPTNEWVDVDSETSTVKLLT